MIQILETLVCLILVGLAGLTIYGIIHSQHHHEEE
uniref:Uncharacterized protein n=1 Tax=Myoviridae sp. ctx322 TaxID=2826711 RepID=A0A8S5NBC2_9CAUD|nr:MAG TPA: hypothetical protein [Myoviridae sp. ctx322]